MMDSCSLALILKCLFLLIALGALGTITLYNYMLIVQLRQQGPAKDVRLFKFGSQAAAGGAGGSSLRGADNTYSKLLDEAAKTEAIEVEKTTAVDVAKAAAEEKASSGGLMKTELEKKFEQLEMPAQAAKIEVPKPAADYKPSGKDDDDIATQMGNLKEKQMAAAAALAQHESPRMTTKKTEAKPYNPPVEPETPAPAELPKNPQQPMVVPVPQTQVQTQATQPQPQAAQTLAPATNNAANTGGVSFGMGGWTNGKEAISFSHQESDDVAFSAWVYLPEIPQDVLPDETKSIKTIAATKRSGCGVMEDTTGWAFFVHEWGTLNQQLRLSWTNQESACIELYATTDLIPYNKWVLVGFTLTQNR